MNKVIKFIIVGALIFQGLGCASKTAEDDLSLDETAAANSPADGEDFGDALADSEAEAGGDTSNNDVAASDQAEDDLKLDDEASGQDVAEVAVEDSKNEQPPQEKPAEEDPFADAPLVDMAGNQEPAPPAEPPPVETTEVLPPGADETAIAETPAPEMSTQLAEITGLKFQANDTGGTILIESTQPVEYRTRTNPELRQFIVEIDNAVLPAKLKRTLNTKDIRGSVGAVDAYQSAGSSTARIVIQLREGVGEPAIQQEGKTLLVVASMPAPAQVAAPAPVDQGDPSLYANEADPNADLMDSNILSSHSLSDYMAGNVKFYGKKISLEMNNMDIREALRFITDETGLNMVISDEVKGNVSLKLRQVPWDQALIVLMKTKNLGYTRQGNVLRITTMEELLKEEDRATKLVADKKNLEPLKVRMFPISYAKVDDLEKKMKDFVTERGRIVGDTRINAIVVTDTEESLVKVAKLIESLDVQPPQVLIEGKVVEAKESFQRDIGVSWSASGQSIKLGQSRRGPVNMTPSFSVNKGTVGAGNLGINLNVGSLDIFGTLDAALSLRESENVVKVLSSPRIMALSNETAAITQTSEVPVRTTTITNGTPQISYQFKPLTLKLEVTPQITSDASIIMKLNISRQFKGATLDANEGTFEVNAREATTRVLVKNGHTAVIGGIYTNEMTDAQSGVPGLRSLPLVGGLFANNQNTKDKSEMLIFLTPRIVGQANTGGKSASDF